MRRKQLKYEHPGIIFKEQVLYYMYLSVEEAAKLMKVTNARLSSFVAGETTLSVEFADLCLRITAVFGGTPQLWHYMMVRYELQEAIPRINKLKLKRYRPKSKKSPPVKETKSRDRKVKNAIK